MKGLFSAVFPPANVAALKNLDAIERARIILGCAAVLCVAYVILQSLGVFPHTWWPN
ncbi:MAG TPA: hypothetical protein VKH64_06745 [Candidatus Binatia bacterium]|nr:hypothetical protein [Candidatus Binatia bacterium]